MIPDREADRLLGQALVLAADMRDDLTAAHRTVRYLNRLELEQLCCALAALVPVDMPLSRLAWWRAVLPSFEELAAGATREVRG